MLGRKISAPFICARCRHTLQYKHVSSQPQRRAFTGTTASPLGRSTSLRDGQQSQDASTAEERQLGAMSRRLEEMSERGLEEGGRSAQKAVEDAGFDEELKERLLNRIAGDKFKVDNQQAFAQANLPSSAGRGTRDIAGAKAWTGTESVEDAALRMLDDAHKRMRMPSRIPSPARIPSKIDTGRPKGAPSSGSRLANARDRSSMYSYLRDDSISKDEKEQMRKELKEKFTPGARSVPATLSGLTKLANERIEDAIARGQFKNLPRGKAIERDYNMSSPFLDTTEYFLNKMIKKQDIVPPWIEKQQELVAEATKFRSRIRNDWTRHAARVIASRGGTLESQVRVAEEYARAEEIVNPSKRKVENLNTVDSEGHVSQITLSGQLQPPKDGESEPVVKITVEDEASSSSVSQAQPPESDSQPTEADPSAPPSTSAGTKLEDVRVVDGAVFPFRDSAWENLERAYHKLAIESLNTLTRSYNLMAPNLAKKPYFALDRELRSCFADVAPRLANEIRERARAPKIKVEIIQHREGGILEKIGGGAAKVYDSPRPHYGFKEFWQDVFGKKNTI